MLLPIGRALLLIHWGWAAITDWMDQGSLRVCGGKRKIQWQNLRWRNMFSHFNSEQCWENQYKIQVLWVVWMVVMQNYVQIWLSTSWSSRAPSSWSTDLSRSNCKNSAIIRPDVCTCVREHIKSWRQFTDILCIQRWITVLLQLPFDPLITWTLSPALIRAWTSVVLLAPGITISVDPDKCHFTRHNSLFQLNC